MSTFTTRRYYNQTNIYQNCQALASLTATYTDSEPEGEDDDDRLSADAEKKSGSEDEVEKDKEAPLGFEVEPVPVKPPELPNRVAKLVSYHDDTGVSDEEGELGHRSENRKSDEPEVELPPEPAGEPSPALQGKVSELLKLHLDMNKIIQSRKDFRNPSIYEKLIQFCNLNELGTNYPADVYDPSKWNKESYYEELAKVQKVEMDRREKEKKERTKVEYVVGTKKPNPSSGDEDLKKRKSKWDQVGSAAMGAGGMQMGVIRPAGLLQPSLTSAVTGTKGTVISAFGSLPKKPRM